MVLDLVYELDMSSLVDYSLFNLKKFSVESFSGQISDKSNEIIKSKII